MKSFDSFKQKVDNLVSDFLSSEDVIYVSESDLRNFKTGIDYRATNGGFWWSTSMIAVEIQHRSRLDYYGGFEYVDKEYITVVGGYVFYSISDDEKDDRVNRVIYRLIESHRD